MYAAQLQCTEARCCAIFDASGSLEALSAQTCPYCRAPLDIVPSWDPEHFEGVASEYVELQEIQSPLSA